MNKIMDGPCKMKFIQNSLNNFRPFTNVEGLELCELRIIFLGGRRKILMMLFFSQVLS